MGFFILPSNASLFVAVAFYPMLATIALAAFGVFYFAVKAARLRVPLSLSHGPILLSVGTGINAFASLLIVHHTAPAGSQGINWAAFALIGLGTALLFYGDAAYRRAKRKFGLQLFLALKNLKKTDG